MTILDRVSRIVTLFNLGVLSLAQAVAQLSAMAGLPTKELARIIQELREDYRNK